jgi:hypothetical protein
MLILLLYYSTIVFTNAASVRFTVVKMLILLQLYSTVGLTEDMRLILLL